MLKDGAIILAGLYLLREYLEGRVIPSGLTRDRIEALLRKGIPIDKPLSDNLCLNRLIERLERPVDE